jgi:hypothetical protein
MLISGWNTTRRLRSFIPTPCGEPLGSVGLAPTPHSLLSYIYSSCVLFLVFSSKISNLFYLNWISSYFVSPTTLKWVTLSKLRIRHPHCARRILLWRRQEEERRLAQWFRRLGEHTHHTYLGGLSVTASMYRLVSKYKATSDRNNCVETTLLSHNVWRLAKLI